MQPREIIEKLGLKIYIAQEDYEWEDVLGAPPVEDVGLVRTYDGEWLVLVERDNMRNLVTGIHEALHAVVGPESFECEGEGSGLMAVEWAVCQQLEGEAYEYWRREFATYGVGGGELGMEDSFQVWPLWKSYVKKAQENGLLDEEGNPTWSGIHPEMHEYELAG